MVPPVRNYRIRASYSNAFLTKCLYLRAKRAISTFYGSQMPEKYHSHQGDVYFLGPPKSKMHAISQLSSDQRQRLQCMLHQCTCCLNIAYHEALHRQKTITRVQLHPICNTSMLWEIPKCASHMPPNYMWQAINRRPFTPLGKARINERLFSEKATRNWTLEFSSHTTICHWA